MKKLTEGNITKQIISFSIPLLAGTALLRLYTLVDTMMVGRFLGTDPLAAVGATANIANLFSFICWGFASGFSIIIGQAYGEENEGKLKKTIAHTYLLSVILVAILTVIGLILKEKILFWTQIPEELHGIASTYLTISVLGLSTSMLYNVISNVLRALGDSFIPLVFQTVSVILNIILDYVFIAILGKGVAGAAVATVISQLVSGIASLIYCLFKRRTLIVSLKDFSMKENYLSLMIPQGISMSMMISVVTTGTVILQTGINSLGADIIAGYTAGRKYVELFFMPGGALSSTAAAFTSQNYGAKQFDRIRKATRQIILIAWIINVLEWIAVIFFAEGMVKSITGNNVDAGIINAGKFYMITNLPFYAFVSVLVIVRSALQGMNKKKTPVIASIMEMIVKIIAVAVFVPCLGFTGIVITEPLIWILGAAWVWIIYSRTLKIKMKENSLIS
ncbi:MATE family efflux transporter [Treponema sp.]|uniref:MATE family efflux transporter n=1 Tax=Treponema sp. TaxID=166 RepID=UPI001D4332AA|nr:MATE family efflux transporter [Treponema sp.]MBS7242645.1 MATE family efflux transporter [Treponema sp.]MCI6442741.1 MATE family efflux transporter [Spirochaetia bacterium]MDY4133001.1 MATE family efflux transporter [Treponema sp.]